jgi:hypothetical protein
LRLYIINKFEYLKNNNNFFFFKKKKRNRWRFKKVKRRGTKLVKWREKEISETFEWLQSIVKLANSCRIEK